MALLRPCPIGRVATGGRDWHLVLLELNGVFGYRSTPPPIPAGFSFVMILS